MDPSNTPGLRTRQHLGRRLAFQYNPLALNTQCLGCLARPSLTGSPSLSSMLPSRCGAALPSEVSPATLDKSLFGLSLGLHCVEDCDELSLYPSLPDCPCQNLSSDFGFHIFDVVPTGIVESTLNMLLLQGIFLELPQLQQKQNPSKKVNKVEVPAGEPPKEETLVHATTPRAKGKAENRGSTQVVLLRLTLSLLNLGKEAREEEKVLASQHQ